MYPPEVEVLGFPFAALTLDEATRYLLSSGERDEPWLIFTPNPEMIERAMRDAALKDILLSADLLLADGIGVVLASRIMGNPLPEVIPGIDLMERLLVEGAHRRLRVFLLGTTPESVEAAARRIAEVYPGIRVVGCHHGYFAEPSTSQVVKLIRGSKPDLVFVGMGVPRDQVFLSRTKPLLPAALYLGVGGAIDVFSGKVMRAPGILRRLRLEWLYRLISSPTRWRRQLDLPRFVWRVLKTRLAGKTSLR
ncbi:MAG: WecB/TagA/CpsF family glycosyltransferase [Clostridia bacterium]